MMPSFNNEDDSMKTHIITTFDKNHLGRAVAFRESLYRFSPDSPVSFLLLDDTAYEMAKCLNLPNTTLLRPEDINDTELLQTRKDRTIPEFASTTKPAFLLYMMKSGKVGTHELLGFIDVDILFYQPATPLFEKIFINGSIAITPHNFPKRREHEQAQKGTYNAGMVFFRNDPSALRCLEEWRRQCIEWCYLRYEDGKIGDQGYLSDWPKKYEGVLELRDKGVNLSTWNIENYKITLSRTDGFFIDNDPLICYHFHGLKIYFDRAGRIQAYPITIFHKEIYRSCIAALQKAYTQLHTLDKTWVYGTSPRPDILRLVKQRIIRAFSR
jgi:hypothetical protein